MIVSIKAAMVNFPFTTTINCGIHIERLDVAIRQAQKVATTSPKVILPSLTSLDPSQIPWTNIAIMTNCANALVKPHTLFRRLTATLRDSKARVAFLSSKSWALKALTVDMAVRARLTSVAVELTSDRS